MQPSTGNIFSDPLVNKSIPESFESLVITDDLLVERIVTGETFTTPGQWYDQDKDEWVVLMQGQAEMEFEDNEVLGLNRGDYIFIPAHKRHRVKAVSKSPNCIWLAIHGNLK
jgi:cupin 2 domain-containing protein